MALLVSNVPLRRGRDPRLELARRLGVEAGEILAFECVRESLDARARRPRRVCGYRVELRDERSVLARGLPGVREVTPRDERRWGRLPARRARWHGPGRPVVVGAGPAGLFAALELARAGARPLLLERGEPVEERGRRVQRFWRHGELDPESNPLFGEGGAGTYSDGKLYTRRRDGEVGEVLRALVDFGAPPSILRDARPHLGTDALRRILRSFREELLRLGAELRFGARVEAFLRRDGRCAGVRLAGGEELEAAAVFVAPGHSARDTAHALLEAGAAAVQRPIAVGVRAEHPQELVDRALLGRRWRELSPAAYQLSWRGREGEVAYSFCMCPGGLVVAATHLPGHLALNGMSFSGRGSRRANAALVVPVGPELYPGRDPLAGHRFQAELERRAFELGGGGFRAPAQRARDFLDGRPSRELPRSTYPLGLAPAELDRLLPGPVVRALRRALPAFARRIPGFLDEGLLLAPESRTTSPVRFLRGPELQSTSLPGLYPVGEGCGYGGGIVSAALDGLRVARAACAASGERG